MAVIEADRPVASVKAEPRIVARVLGTFEIAVDGCVVDRAAWQRVSAERLVKLLLVSDAHTIARERALETLWPETDPEAGRANLRKALHCARHALEVPGAIVGDGDVIRLDQSLFEVDLDRLRTVLDEIARPRAPGPDGDGLTNRALSTVLELGHRPLLPDDAYEDWLVTPREHLRTRWQVVAMDAARMAAAAGHRADAHTILEQVLECDPTDEAAHRLAIELYASEGRHHAARRQFELCRQALADGLDATPSAQTVAAYRAAEVSAQRAPTPAPRSRLVARRQELERIEPLLDQVGAGRLAGLVLRGPAGIGKTRLLDEVRRYCLATGWRDLSWQAIEPSNRFAFAPFALRFGELVAGADAEQWPEPERSAMGTVVPGLGMRGGLTFADRSALVAALAAALARIAGAGPLIVTIDDLPWLDEASIEVLASAVAEFADVPILVAVTYRDEEPVPSSADVLLERLRRVGALDMRLGPLAERDTEPLVLAHLGGESLAPAVATWLFRQSEGNPLFCLEAVRDAAARGAVALDNGRWRETGELGHEPPPAVRHLVAARVRSLPAAATRLLATAAALGPVVAYDTLSAVLADLEGGLIPALDAALASGLLVECAGGYAFAHPLFRVAVESESGAARRAGLHLALAQALAGATAADADLDPARLAEGCADPGPAAEHALAAFELGRRGAGPLAVALGFAAGLRARRLFDRRAATSFLERAVTIWQRLPASSAAPFDAATAFVNLAELQMVAGDEVRAEVAFRSALDAARTPDELAYAYERFTWLGYRHGDFAGAIALCEEALARLPADADVARAVLDVRIGFCLGRLDRIAEAVERLEHAVHVFDSAGDRAHLALALDHLGPFLSFAGRNADGIAAVERSLALALDLRDGPVETMARIHLVGLLSRSGRAKEARRHAQRGLELAEQAGDWYIASVGAWLTAESEDSLGNHGAAARLRHRELDWLARIGGNPHNEALAHAHLAHLARIAGDPAAEAEEAARAREAAARDPDAGYARRIEAALTAVRWAAVQEH